MLYRHATRKPIQETGCVLIACSRCINNALYWLGLNVHEVATIDDN